MSMHKAIKSGKEHRKEWEDKGSYCKSVDTHCQNHGGRYKSWECPYCKSNRMHSSNKRLKVPSKKLREFIENETWSWMENKEDD